MIISTGFGRDWEALPEFDLMQNPGNRWLLPILMKYARLGKLKPRPFCGGNLGLINDRWCAGERLTSGRSGPCE
jgi:hypothetical protein